MSAPATQGDRRTQRSRDLPLVLVAALIGLVTSPFLAVYTGPLGLLVAGVAGVMARGRPESTARRVAVAAVGVVAGAAVYFLLALVVGASGGAPGSGSGSG